MDLVSLASKDDSQLTQTQDNSTKNASCSARIFVSRQVEMNGKNNYSLQNAQKSTHNPNCRICLVWLKSVNRFKRNLCEVPL